MVASGLTIAALKQSPAVASVAWALTASTVAHVMMDAVEITVGMTVEQALSLFAWSTIGMLGGAARIAHSSYRSGALPEWTLRRSFLVILFSGFVGMMAASLIDGFPDAWIYKTGPRVFAVSLAAFSADAVLSSWDVAMRKSKLGSALSEAIRSMIQSFAGAGKKD